MSFLIQRSPDQCLFAAPRSLSQLITSFIGSQCQGIRPAPLFALSNKAIFRTFGILLILSFKIVLPFLLKLQYFLRTYYNLFVSVIIQFSRYVFECPFPGPLKIETTSTPACVCHLFPDGRPSSMFFHLPDSRKEGDPAAGSPTGDFTPITSFYLRRRPPCGDYRLRVPRPHGCDGRCTRPGNVFTVAC